MMPMFTRSVGVSPGTTTFQLGACGPDPARWNGYDRANPIDTWRAADPGAYGAGPRTLSGAVAGSSLRVLDRGRVGFLGAIDTRAKLRWDIIAGIGGAALLIATTAGLVASALK